MCYTVASFNCVKCWGSCSFPSHLQSAVWEYAERRSRPTVPYLLWSSHSNQTEVREAARRGLPGAWPRGQHSVWQKHKHRGPSNPLGCYAAKHHPPYFATRHTRYIHCRFNNLAFQQQFVLETHILDGRNLTLLMLWFCSHVLIKHNKNCAVLALMKHWGRWTEKRSSYPGCSFKLYLSAVDLV